MLEEFAVYGAFTESDKMSVAVLKRIPGGYIVRDKPGNIYHVNLDGRDIDAYRNGCYIGEFVVTTDYICEISSIGTKVQDVDFDSLSMFFGVKTKSGLVGIAAKSNDFEDGLSVSLIDGDKILELIYNKFSYLPIESNMDIVEVFKWQ